MGKKQHQLVNLQFWRSEVQTVSLSSKQVLGGQGSSLMAQAPICLLSPASRGYPYSLVCGPFQLFVKPVTTSQVFLQFSLETPPSFARRTLVITLGAPGSPSKYPASQGQLVSNINSICSMMPSPCNTTHIHSFWELEGGHLWTRDYFASYSAYLFWSVGCFSFSFQL